jgi:hypothetical protein
VKAAAKKTAKLEVEPLGQLVQADLATYLRATDLVIPLDDLRLDTKAGLGQIRTMRQERLAAAIEPPGWHGCR